MGACKLEPEPAALSKLVFNPSKREGGRAPLGGGATGACPRPGARGDALSALSSGSHPLRIRDNRALRWRLMGGWVEVVAAPTHCARPAHVRTLWWLLRGEDHTRGITSVELLASGTFATAEDRWGWRGHGRLGEKARESRGHIPQPGEARWVQLYSYSSTEGFRGRGHLQVWGEWARWFQRIPRTLR